jgi:ATP/maltotriose-dependent transcriptional regulator MalT
VAVNTVKKHISNIFGKLGVSNRVQAVSQARLLGLL